MSTEPQPAIQTPQPDVPPQQPGPQPQQPGPQPQTQTPPHHKIRHTRISGLWFALAFFAVLLLFLLIFILENGQKVDISFLGAHGHLPLGVALLLAAVCGVLLAIAAGVARMAQLRSVARKHRRADA
jgi:lipopolysaccharide assembly protein A